MPLGDDDDDEHPGHEEPQGFPEQSRTNQKHEIPTFQGELKERERERERERRYFKNLNNNKTA
jgi:hypothetical protein